MVTHKQMFIYVFVLVSVSVFNGYVSYWRDIRVLNTNIVKLIHTMYSGSNSSMRTCLLIDTEASHRNTNVYSADVTKDMIDRCTWVCINGTLSLQIKDYFHVILVKTCVCIYQINCS